MAPRSMLSLGWGCVSCIATSAVVTAIARIATPPAGISSFRGCIDRSRSNGVHRQCVRRGKPAAARWSSSAANSGRGAGRRAWRSAISWSSLGVSIAGLPQLGHCAVKLGAGVRLAQAEHLGDLGVGEAGEALERDQLALAWIEPLQRGGDGQAPLVVLGSAEALDVGGFGCQLRLPPATPQLVEGRVAGDPEQPRPRLAPLGVDAVALAVGPLEGSGGHFLRRRRVSEQAGDVGVDVVAAGAVEPLEGEVAGAGRIFCLGAQRLLHARTTGYLRIR